ncbi:MULTISPECIES: hypothetical protein [unclassified Streptomyces]
MSICIAPGEGLSMATAYCGFLVLVGLVLIAILGPIWTVLKKLFRR